MKPTYRQLVILAVAGWLTALISAACAVFSALNQYATRWFSLALAVAVAGSAMASELPEDHSNLTTNEVSAQGWLVLAVVGVVVVGGTAIYVTYRCSQDAAARVRCGFCGRLLPKDWAGGKCPRCGTAVTTAGAIVSATTNAPPFNLIVLQGSGGAEGCSWTPLAIVPQQADTEIEYLAFDTHAEWNEWRGTHDLLCVYECPQLDYAHPSTLYRMVEQ